MNRFRLLKWGLYLFLFAACTSNKEEAYFNGELKLISSFEKEKKLLALNVPLDDINDDRMLVCDSFLLFQSYKYKDYWIYAFDKQSGKLVGKLFPKGDGPNDFQFYIDSEQFLTNSSNETLLWIRNPYHSCRLVNISRSLQTRKTIYDSIIPMKWMEKFQFPAPAMFFLADSLILARNQCEEHFINDHAYTPGRYLLYKNSLKNFLKEFTLYRKAIVSSDQNDRTPSASYYSSYDRIKPDGTKVAMAMQSIGQINVLDILTGKLIGLRQKGSITFEELGNSKKERRYYYTTLAVDDDFIFAAYSGATYRGGYPELSHEIHIFNWEGRSIFRLMLSEPVFCVSYDAVGRMLYGNDFNNNVWRYDVSFLYEKYVSCR